MVRHRSVLLQTVVDHDEIYVLVMRSRENRLEGHKSRLINDTRLWNDADEPGEGHDTRKVARIWEATRWRAAIHRNPRIYGASFTSNKPQILAMK